ncbi:MAG: hypothetical protein H6656_02555 [Ardenticatenaceae bacterium]|nr:hypothetical protein [Ardenticatenaceae bacterium]
MRIWDFEQNLWQPLGTVIWGKNLITDFAPFGPNNEVRLRLKHQQPVWPGHRRSVPNSTGNLNEGINPKA